VFPLTQNGETAANRINLLRKAVFQPWAYVKNIKWTIGPDILGAGYNVPCVTDVLAEVNKIATDWSAAHSDPQNPTARYKQKISELLDPSNYNTDSTIYPMFFLDLSNYLSDDDTNKANNEMKTHSMFVYPDDKQEDPKSQVPINSLELSQVGHYERTLLHNKHRGNVGQPIPITNWHGQTSKKQDVLLRSKLFDFLTMLFGTDRTKGAQKTSENRLTADKPEAALRIVCYAKVYQNDDCDFGGTTIGLSDYVQWFDETNDAAHTLTHKNDWLYQPGSSVLSFPNPATYDTMTIVERLTIIANAIDVLNAGLDFNIPFSKIIPAGQLATQVRLFFGYEFQLGQCKPIRKMSCLPLQLAGDLSEAIFFTSNTTMGNLAYWDFGPNACAKANGKDRSCSVFVADPNDGTVNPFATEAAQTMTGTCGTRQNPTGSGPNNTHVGILRATRDQFSKVYTFLRGTIIKAISDQVNALSKSTKADSKTLKDITDAVGAVQKGLQNHIEVTQQMKLGSDSILSGLTAYLLAQREVNHVYSIMGTNLSELIRTNNTWLTNFNTLHSNLQTLKTDLDHLTTLVNPPLGFSTDAAPKIPDQVESKTVKKKTPFPLWAILTIVLGGVALIIGITLGVVLTKKT